MVPLWSVVSLCRNSCQSFSCHFSTLTAYTTIFILFHPLTPISPFPLTSIFPSPSHLQQSKTVAFLSWLQNDMSQIINQLLCNFIIQWVLFLLDWTRLVYSVILFSYFFFLFLIPSLLLFHFLFLFLYFSFPFSVYYFLSSFFPFLFTLFPFFFLFRFFFPSFLLSSYFPFLSLSLSFFFFFSLTRPLYISYLIQY